MNNGASGGPPAVQFVTITADYQGQRIDNFLVTYLKGVPKSLIYKVLRKGEVRVNKGRSKPEYRLQAGDEIRIPPIRVTEARSPVLAGQRLLDLLKNRVLYEDNELIIINKPSAMAVHGGSGVSLGVIEALRQADARSQKLELVHRLDRDTSGCLILAKKRSALRQLHDQLRENAITKYYLALVKGRMAGGRRAVDLPLLKNTLKSGERIVVVNDAGKEALSFFEPVTLYRQATLVGVHLKTGRTHQIRVHAAHIGHPVAGDEKYGDAGFNTEMRTLGLKRLFLHARSLEFDHPVTGQHLCITAPLDEDLDNLLDKLESKS